jgi:hypothetical protein
MRATMVLKAAVAMLIACAAGGIRPVGATMTASAAPKEADAGAPEERARKERDEALARIDADHRRAKADVLRRYAEDLTDAELDAARGFDLERAQRLFEEVQSVREEVARLLRDQKAGAQGDARAQPDFAITISDFDGAAGFTKVLELGPSKAVLNLQNDYGRPQKELWRTDLAIDQRERLSKFLAEFPLQRLREKYVDPSVFDGYQVTFKIRVGKLGPRTIFVGNQRQRDLDRLVLEINRIVPPKFWISRIGVDEPGGVRVRRAR